MESCFIGTDITGSTGVFAGASGIGIDIRGGDVTIGGNLPAARNVISGNSYIGIWAEFAGGTLNIQGNLIGLSAAGNAALPRQDYGLYIETMPLGVMVGGTSPGTRNVISGNEFGGIYRFVSSFPPNGLPTRIEGNWFGTDAAGVLSVPNGIVPNAGATFPVIYGFGGGSCGMSVGGGRPGAT